MGKGLRSSVKKTNRSKLRASVFGPVESERAERIHAKLLETIQQPKPELPKKAAMDVDSEDAAATEDTSKDDLPKEMDVDDGAAPSTTSKTSLRKRSEIKKARRKVKPRNAIAFPKSKGKGALKPFSDSRVRKQRK